MDKTRRYYSNRLEAEVRTIQGYVTRNKATIRRFREQGDATISQRIDSLKEKIEEQENEIKEKTLEANEIRAGLRDAEIISKTKTTQKETKSKHNETMRLKKEKTLENTKRKEISESYYQAQLQSNRNERQLDRDMKYHYRRFEKICSGIPSYIERNLNDMPHNKGYIWRGIWLFGKKKAEYNRPQLMFERKTKTLLLIHEYDRYEMRLYEKHGKNKRVLVKTTPRKQIV